MERFDVVIVGAGLAGASTALRLSRAGLTCALVDKQEFPRDKPCGEGLLPHGVAALRALGVGEVLDEIEAQPFRGILYRFPGVTAAGDFPHGNRGLGFQRRLLDARIRARALAAPGVTAIDGQANDVVHHAQGAAVVLRSGARIEGRVVVGADGPRSVVRQVLGLDGGAPRAPRFALRRHFELPAGAALPDRVEVTVVDGYELYVTPTAPGVVNVAALCEKHVMHDGNGRPDARLDGLLARAPAVGDRLHGAKPLDDARACGPLRVRSRAVHRGACVLVGDAAGYVDAITGEGMSLALGTGELAAHAIRAVVVDGVPAHVAFRRYARQRAALFRDHAILTFGLVFLARHHVLARRAIARLAREPALFTRLLAVNDGQQSLLGLGVVDLAKLAIGARPPQQEFVRTLPNTLSPS
jgi:flavin-dependent dehydrogenase